MPQVPLLIPDVGALANNARALPGRALGFVGQLPRAVAGEISRRVRMADLATKHDVELQHRLARKRMSRLLEDFLKEQRTHEDALLATLRSDIREELQSFADAVQDEDFGISEALEPYTSPSRRPLSELDYLDDDEDEDDLVDLTAEELAEIVNDVKTTSEGPLGSMTG